MGHDQAAVGRLQGDQEREGPRSPRLHREAGGLVASHEVELAGDLVRRVASVAARELELVAAHRDHDVHRVARAIPEGDGDLTAPRREPDRPTRRLDTAQLAVERIVDARDGPALTTAARLS